MTADLILVTICLLASLFATLYSMDNQDHQESPLFFPSLEFKQHANIQSRTLFEEASKNRDAFWAKQAECLHWFEPWKQVVEWHPPYAKWFVGGKLNACYNCLDRHIETENRHKAALIWEGERGENRVLTYEDLYREVNQFSCVLKSVDIKKGDRVVIYLPLIPEAVVAMLSCARIGAVHSVVFGGFSAEALKDRILDTEAKLLITATGGFRKGKLIPLKEAADVALAECPSVKNVIVVDHPSHSAPMMPHRDLWYRELMKNAPTYCPPEKMDAEEMLYILYTSGSTGKPKGIVHTTGGYMVGVTATTRWVFDIKPSDIFWCTADVGWVTGHSYIVYGPLSNAMTLLIYEGAMDWPERNRMWKLIEKHRVTTLYTAPTLIRTLMKWGEEWIKGSDLSSLRLLGSVGEPINPEAWLWYHKHVGQERCPIVDTWWQTETGSIMISAIPGLTPLKAGSATQPLPGIDASIMNQQGEPTSSGFLALTSPWPSMLRGIYKNAKLYEDTYWKKWDGKHYFTGDAAKQDRDGYFWLMGRIDDVINVSGHRIGSMEIESALVDNQLVAEAAAIGMAHPIKGQGIVAFVVLKERVAPNEELEKILIQHIVKLIGSLARPEKIIFIHELPKTRSGKIMRRLLRDIAEGHVLGDLTTLSDPSVINEIKGKYLED